MEKTKRVKAVLAPRVSLKIFNATDLIKRLENLYAQFAQDKLQKSSFYLCVVSLKRVNEQLRHRAEECLKISAEKVKKKVSTLQSQVLTKIQIVYQNLFEEIKTIARVYLH